MATKYRKRSRPRSKPRGCLFCFNAWVEVSFVVLVLISTITLGYITFQAQETTRVGFAAISLCQTK